jgi:hypothetical protein
MSSVQNQSDLCKMVHHHIMHYLSAIGLDNNFTSRWIGQRGTVQQASRSLHLNPVDFTNWGYLKSLVYLVKLMCLEHLKQWISDKGSLTFNGRTFKLPGALCGQNLIGPKSFKLQTFRKNYIFSVLCSLEIRTKNRLKDNEIFYIYTKSNVYNWKLTVIVLS